MLRSMSLIALAVGLWGAAMAVGAQNVADDAARREPDVVALPSAGVAKVTALGFRELMADLYFLRGLQYYGNPWNNRDDYRYLYPLVNLATDLDPDYKDPLLWGSIAVQKNLGREVWINTAESTRLLQKGARQFPREWRFHFFLGYNLAVFDHDYRGAARSLERTLGLEGTPEYVPALITRLYSTAGDLDAAAALAAGVLDGSDDPKLKEQMQARLVDIETERGLRQIDQAVRTLHAASGRWPASVEELVAQGALAGLPAEPRGGQWRLDPETHLARSSAMAERLRVFEPERGAAKRATRPKEIE